MKMFSKDGLKNLASSVKSGVSNMGNTERRGLRPPSEGSTLASHGDLDGQNFGATRGVGSDGQLNQPGAEQYSGAADGNNGSSVDGNRQTAAAMLGSTTQRPSVDYTEEGNPVQQVKISPLQAAWNVTNAIQGMFIVSLPYTVMHGGWWGVLALIGVAAICYYTGIVLVECLYDDDGNRVRGTYRAVAEECWGKALGGRIVLGAQLIELLMTCILYVVLVGDLMENSFPNASMDKPGWMLLAATALLPCAFLTDLRAVSTLSLWNTVSHVIINAVVVLYCFSEIGNWSLSSVRLTINIHTFPTVLGIVVFSYTSHIFLPALEGSLIDRSLFRPMLKWSHIAAAAFKAFFGFVGFLTFARYTNEEVTNNLPSQEFKIVVNLILVAKALLSYPLPYFAVAQIMDHEFFRGPPLTKLPSSYGADGCMRVWTVAVRVVLVIVTLFLALCIPYFALLMGLVGNITGTMLSFVWPALFHLKIKGSQLSSRQIFLNRFIIGLGCLFGTVGIYYSATNLARALTNEDEYG